MPNLDFQKHSQGSKWKKTSWLHPRIPCANERDLTSTDTCRSSTMTSHKRACFLATRRSKGGTCLKRRHRSLACPAMQSHTRQHTSWLGAESPCHLQSTRHRKIQRGICQNHIAGKPKDGLSTQLSHACLLTVSAFQCTGLDRCL
jgi:hypothetical protein